MVDDFPAHDHAARLNVALELVRVGYWLAPVLIHRHPVTGKKAPDYLWAGPGTGWHDRASNDPARVLDWWAQYGDHLSFAVDTGRSGAIGIDLDVVAARIDPKTGEEIAPAVDAVIEWALADFPIGAMLVNTPTGGQHHYWRADPAQELLNAKRVLGLPVDVRAEGGHLFAPGSVIIGTDGVPEPAIYALQGPLVAVTDLAPLPEEFRAKLAAPGRERAPRSAQGALKDRGWVIAQCQDQLEVIRRWPPVEGQGFRHALLGAGMMLGRAVAGSIITRPYAEKRLGDAAYGVWGSVDVDDLRWIRDGLDHGEEDPWTILRPSPERAHLAPDEIMITPQVSGHVDLGPRSTPGFSSTDSDETSDDPLAEPTTEELAARRRARLLADEIERQEIREEAARELVRRRRGARPSIASGVIDDLDEIEPPAMLLGSLIPEDAVGILSGRSGSYKSFLGAAWAACIGTGRPWLDREEFTVSRPRTVLYVAAEGPRGAAGRLRAWEAATGQSRAGKVLLYPRPVMLNDPDHAEELAQYAGENDIGFVVIDTLRVSTRGAEENSSTDWGHSFGAMTRLRDDHGCGSLLIDHSGHAEDWRPRGTSAKVTDPDYLLSVTYDGAGAGPQAQRELTVRKLKDDEVDGHWPVLLRPVQGQRFPVVDIGRLGDRGKFVPAGRWWEPEAVPMPETIREVLGTGRGSAAARDVWRVLRFVNNAEGLTPASIRGALREAPPERQHSVSALEAGLALLVKTKVAARGITGRSTYALTRMGKDEVFDPQ